MTHLLQIQSDESEVRRKGRILQILIIALTLLAIVHTLFAPPVTDDQGALLLAQGITSSLFALFCLFLVRNGRVRTTTHLFFIVQTLIQGAVLILTGETGAFAYYLLVNPISIAVLDSPRNSLFYTAAILGFVLVYAQNPRSGGSDFFVGYVLTTLGITLSIWLAADYLQVSLSDSRDLTSSLRENSRRLQTTNLLMEERTRQLQRSAEISQKASVELNLTQLLQETCSLIGNEFGYYFVCIYLADAQTDRLELRAATGAIGQDLHRRKFAVPLDARSIVAWTARQRQPRVVRDVQDDPVYLLLPELKETRSELALPLVARGELLGVLDVQSRVASVFQTDEISILQILANQTAVNIDNARLFTETEARLSEMESLYTLNTLLTTTLDVGEIYRRAAISFTEQLDVSHCTIFSWEPDDNTITVQIDYTKGPTAGASGVYDLQHNVYQLKPNSNTQRVLQTLDPLLHHVGNPDLSTSVRERLAEFEQVSTLEIPLVRGVEAVGLVQLYREVTQARFNQADVRFAQTMATQVANALYNATIASESRARVAQLSMLNRISAAFSLAPTLKDVFDSARREIMSLVEATGMSIVLLSEQEGMLDWIYAYEYGQEVDLSSIPALPISQGFSGQVVRTRKIFHINKDIELLHEQLQSTTIGAFPSSWLGLPLIVANELIGVLAVENEHDDDAFADRDIELLQTISGPLAITINNLIQFEQIQAALAAQSEQRLQLQTAAEVAAAATSILDQQDLMDRAVNLIRERFELYYAGLFLIDETGKTAVLRAGTGDAGRIQLERGHALAVGGRSLIGGATADGVSRISQDVTQDKEWKPNPILPHTQSELALPLKVRNRVIGAITVQSAAAHAFSPELVGILETMTSQLAVAIENTRLLSRAEARAAQQQRINDISTQLYRTADVSEIIRAGLQAISAELNHAPVRLQLGTVLDDTRKSASEN